MFQGRSTPLLRCAMMGSIRRPRRPITETAIARWLLMAEHQVGSTPLAVRQTDNHRRSFVPLITPPCDSRRTHFSTLHVEWEDPTGCAGGRVLGSGAALGDHASDSFFPPHMDNIVVKGNSKSLRAGLIWVRSYAPLLSRAVAVVRARSSRLRPSP